MIPRGGSHFLDPQPENIITTSKNRPIWTRKASLTATPLLAHIISADLGSSLSHALLRHTLMDPQPIKGQIFSR